MRRLPDWRESLPNLRPPEPPPLGEPLPRERPRETLHPNDPEWRARAIEWGRRAPERESILGHGSVVPFGWIKTSEAERLKRLDEDVRAEAARRLFEDERIVWCEDAPACWPDERAAGWCGLEGYRGFADEGGDDWAGVDGGEWAWCNEDRVAWCLDEGGGWLPEGDAWTDEESERWTAWDDELLAGAWAAWCDDD